MILFEFFGTYIEHLARVNEKNRYFYLLLKPFMGKAGYNPIYNPSCSACCVYKNDNGKLTGVQEVEYLQLQTQQTANGGVAAPLEVVHCIIPNKWAFDDTLVLVVWW